MRCVKLQEWALGRGFVTKQAVREKKGLGPEGEGEGEGKTLK